MIDLEKNDPERPVEDPDNFFGQKGIVRRIFSRIGCGRPQSVAIIGGRKTGKTSLLNYISNSIVKEKSLENPEDYIFIKISSKGDVSKNAEKFISEINQNLSKKIEDNNIYNTYNTSDTYYNLMQKIVEDIHLKGKKLILFLDDFHFITSSSKFPLEFFSFLRSLANNYNVAYITTSFLELQRLCVIKDVQESPFLIFLLIYLSYLFPWMMV